MNLKNKRIGFALPVDPFPEEIYHEIAKLVSRGAKIIFFPLERGTNIDNYHYLQNNKYLLQTTGGKLSINPPPYPLDLLVIAPCPSYIIGQVAGIQNMISLSSAARQHLNNKRLTVIALWLRYHIPREININIKQLMQKNIYFVPFGPLPLKHRKDAYLASRLDLIVETISGAFRHRCIKPTVWEHSTPP